MLLRAMINITAFSAVWFSIYRNNSVCSIIAAIVLVLCIIVNLVFPFLHRKK